MNKSKMTLPLLVSHVISTGSNHFDRDSMKFFGDKMSNYGVRSQPVEIETRSGEKVLCWVLYRRRPVKHNLWSDTYFCVQTFRKVFSKD